MAKQISEEEIELLVDRLLNRVYKANEYYLKEIGKIIKKVKQLSPSKAQQLIQILKYGGKYEEIVKQLNKYTNLNIKDIDKIFSEYAKKDQLFYEQFYKYRNMPFIKYDENAVLKMQTEALSNVAKNEMYNFTRSNVLGYSIRNEKGILQFTGLRETYNMVLDDALMNVSQGKETFDSAISRILADLGTSGIRTLNYESGRNVRLDSTVRMHLKSRLRELHNENQKLLGKEFGADGIEISVHLNPAPDHEEVQGRQFSNEEYDKLDNGDYAVDYKGNRYTLDHDGKNGYRPISEMNCYHTISSVILGVSPPEYTDLELKRIREDNLAGFEFEGKHYTNYEGTQLQSSLERAIREQKDIQILAKESGNEELIDKSQKKITKLTNKYRELSKQSGLPTSMERLRVSGYRRTKTELVNNEYKTDVWYGDTIYVDKKHYASRIKYMNERIEQLEKDIRIDEMYLKSKDLGLDSNVAPAVIRRANVGELRKIKEELSKINNADGRKITLNSYSDCEELLDAINIKMDKEKFKDCDFDLVKENTKQIYNLTNKYDWLSENISKDRLIFTVNDKLEETTVAQAGKYGIELNPKYYGDKELMYKVEKEGIDSGYFTSVKEEYINVRTITHEFGHEVTYRMNDIYYEKTKEYYRLDEWEEKLYDDFMSYASKKLNASEEDIAYSFISDYGRTEKVEALAEIFANSQLGKSNLLGDLYDEYLRRFMQ